MTRSPLALLAMTWLVAFNLRAGLMGIGPILPNLTADLRLTHLQASILVAIPTAMMGLGALPGGWLADRWGAVRVVLLGLLLTAAGSALRGATGAFGPLIAMTLLFGGGIGLTQPSLPRLTRLWFPRRIGLATGSYATGLVSGATVAAAVTAPLLLPMTPDHSWRLPLLVWGGIALLTAVAWAAAMRPWQPDTTGHPRIAGVDVVGDRLAWSPWRQRPLWVIALICGGQGLVYYLMVSWLPTYYQEAGIGATRAGLLVGAFNLASLPSILFIPALADAVGSRRTAAIGSSLLVIAGGAGLVVAPLAVGWIWVWGPLAAIGVSGLFGLALAMPAAVAPPGHTGGAAGLVLGVGFLISALGPLLAGGLRDLTGSFQAAIVVLPVTGVALLILAALLPGGNAAHPIEPAAAPRAIAPELVSQPPGHAGLTSPGGYPAEQDRRPAGTTPRRIV